MDEQNQNRPGFDPDNILAGNGSEGGSGSDGSDGDQILDSQNRSDFPEDFNTPKQTWWEWLGQHYLAMLSGFLVLVLIAVAGLWFIRNQREQAPDQANVMLNIKGPASMSSGNESEFTVAYTNGENADLTNITLEMFYPSNFRFVSASVSPTSSNGSRFDLPVLRQGQTAEVKIRGRVSGATGEFKELRGKLNFELSNFNSSFFVENSFRTTLTAPELELDIVGPNEVTNGQTTTFTVNYANVSGKEFEATAVELRYPEGFKFISAVPGPSKNNNFWNLGKLAVGASGKIEVTGNFIGDPGTEQQVTGELGLALPSGLAPQITKSSIFKIQASNLSLTQEVTPGEYAKLGQSLQYKINYANYGSVGQSNVVITATLDGALLDLTKLKSSNGIVTGNTITWKSATVNNLSLLSPNQKGDLNFSVPVKTSISSNLKNQVIKNAITIYSDQTTNAIRGSDSEVKIISDLGMVVSGSYVGGALPMTVGQSTTFNITVLLTNLGNDLSGAEVIASMPLPASAWSNVVIPDGEKNNVTFDRNANKIRWRVGNLPAFTGKFSPARTVTFQLQVTPSESDRGRTMTLLSDIQATGTDTFVNKELTSTMLDTLTVDDLGDPKVDGSGATVD